MQKEDKERVVAELTEKIRTADTLIVADYRGLTMPQIDKLRGQLLEHGARFSVVKNTLTRRAAEAAGVDALLALLEGPSAIAFIESGGDMVAVAKALADSARETRVLTLRGGLLQGRTISGEDVEELAKLPPLDALRGQVLAVVIAPLTGLAALLNAPLQNLVGLIDARIEQLADQPSADPLVGAPETQAEALSEAATQAVSETEAVDPDSDTTSQIAEGYLPQPQEEEATDDGS